MQPPADRNAESRGRDRELHERGVHGRRIAIVGASVRSAAQSAKRAGFQVLGIDRFSDTDTLDACDEHFAIGGHESVDRIIQSCRGIPLIPVGGLDSQHSLISQLAAAQSSSVPIDKDPAMRIPAPLRDINYLRELGVVTGIRFPPTFGLGSEGSLSEDEHSSRWLTKQPESCGGLAVRWYRRDQPLPRQSWIQKWIPGRLFGATFLSNGSDVRLLGVCRSLFTRWHDRPFVYSGSMGPVLIAEDLSRMLVRLGEHVTTTIGLRGLFNVDYLVDQSETPWLLEINPRWSGSSEVIERHLIEQGHLGVNRSLFAWMVEALEGKPLSRRLESTAECSPTTARDSTDLKRIIYASKTMRFDRRRAANGLRANETLHDVPRDGTRSDRGEPVCTLIQRIDRAAKNPMRRHRVLVRRLSGASVE